MPRNGRRNRIEEPISRRQFIYGLGALGAGGALYGLTAHAIVYGDLNLQRANDRRLLSTTLHAKRGTMYDCNGNVLVSSADCENVYVNPGYISKKQVEKVVKGLVDVLGISDEDARACVTSDDPFVYVQRQVDEDTAEQLSALDLPGVGMEESVKRVYPYETLASQVIGVSNVDGEGLTGLENYYEELLHGTDGSIVRERAADGTYIAGGAYKKVPAQDGDDLVLTIDINIQRVAEEALKERVEAVGAAYGSALVMIPDTGEILAACSYPTYDPTDLSNARSQDMNLRVVSDTYEPGSVFKPIVVSGGIEAGKIKADSAFQVPASIQVGDDYVSDDDGRDYSMTMDPREILRRSSNAGMVAVANAIGSESFETDVIKRFEIGESMGIDFPGESTGIVRDRENWDGSTLGTMGFGQGISVPPIEIVRATAAIANGGTLVTPHFVKSTKGELIDWSKNDKNILDESVAAAVRDMMVTVVDEGTGTSAQIAGYSVAGKTGTAQQADETGTYRANSFMSSFIGYAPASNPKVLCYITLDQTATHGYVAGPGFVTIMNEALSVLGVAPDR